MPKDKSQLSLRTLVCWDTLHPGKFCMPENKNSALHSCNALHTSDRLDPAVADASDFVIHCTVSALQCAGTMTIVCRDARNIRHSMGGQALVLRAWNATAHLTEPDYAVMTPAQASDGSYTISYTFNKASQSAIWARSHEFLQPPWLLFSTISASTAAAPLLKHLCCLCAAVPRIIHLPKMSEAIRVADVPVSVVSSLRGGCRRERTSSESIWALPRPSTRSERSCLATPCLHSLPQSPSCQQQPHPTNSLIHFINSTVTAGQPIHLSIEPQDEFGNSLLPILGSAALDGFLVTGDLSQGPHVSLGLRLDQGAESLVVEGGLAVAGVYQLQVRACIHHGVKAFQANTNPLLRTHCDGHCHDWA